MATSKSSTSRLPEKVQDWVGQNLESSLRDANLPSTESVNQSLDSARETNAEALQQAKDAGLSNTSQQVLGDMEQAIDATQNLLEKSQNNELQNLLKHGALAASKIPVSKMAGTVSKGIRNMDSKKAGDIKDTSEQAYDQVQQLSRQVFDITRQLVTSSNFREHLERLVDISTAYVRATTERFTGEWKQDRHHKKAAAKAAEKHQQQFEKAVEDLAEPVKEIAERLKNDESLRQGTEQILELFNVLSNQAIEMVQEKADDVKDHAKKAGEEGKHSAESQEAQDHARIAAESAQKILANFGGSLEPLHDSMTELRQLLKEKRPQVNEITSLAQKLLNAPDDWDQKGQELMEKVRDLLQNDQQVTQAFQNLADNSRTFIKTFQKDKSIDKVQDSYAKLVQDLLLDEQGKPTLKRELVDDFQKVLPILLKYLSSFTVGRVESTSDELDLICDNVAVACANLGENININTRTHVAADTANFSNTIHVELKGIRMKVEDLVFYYYRKTFPSMTDVGIADLEVKERGMDIELTLQPSPDKGRMMRVIHTTTTIHDLDVNIKQTNHGWLMTILSPMISSMVSARLEQSINEGLKSNFEKVDESISSTLKNPSSKLSQLSEAGAQMIAPSREE